MEHHLNENEILSKINLEFVNKSDNIDPMYCLDGDSGFDLRAWITSETHGSKFDEETKKWFIELKPLERELVHTGLYFVIPFYCEIQIRPRSGCSLKLGLGVLNSPSTIDSNYTGEIGIVSINYSNETIRIYSGDRVAQGVLTTVNNSYFTNLTKIDHIKKITERGDKGFGHSGMN